MAELDKDPRPLMSRAYGAANTQLAQAAIPNTLETYRNAGPAITSAYKKGGVGAAAGQTVRETGNYAVAGLQDLARSADSAVTQIVKPVIDPAAQALKTAATGDASPITPQAPAAAQRDVRLAEPSATAVQAAMPPAAPTSLDQMAAAPPAPYVAPSIAGPNPNDPNNAVTEAARGQALRDEAAAWQAQRQQSLQGMVNAPAVGALDTSVQAPAVQAGGMISGQVAGLINAKRQRSAQELTLKKYQGDQAAITRANEPMAMAAAKQALDRSDPNKQQDLKKGEQALAQGKLSLADMQATAGLRAKLLDTNASPADKEAAATSLRQMAGKEDEVKIAQYSEPSADGMTVTQNGVVFKNGVPLGTAKDLAKGTQAQAAPVAPSAGSVAHLKSNPALAADFDKRYGAGAAAAILNAKQ